jgi:NAD-dependent deacetylase
MIIAGTSLTVYPAATFAQFLKHDRIVIINKSSTYMDLKALLTIHDNVGDVLDKCVPKRISRKAAATKSSSGKTTTTKKTTAKKSSDAVAKSTASKKAPAKKPSASASKKPASSKAKKDESKS